MKTDTQLQQDVIAELQWEPAVHASQIGVEVREGVVTLAGEVTVRNWAEREAATNSAWASPGVRSVVDKITLAY